MSLSTNPYAAPVAEAAIEQNDTLLLQTSNRVNIGGRAYWPCRLSLYGDRIEMKFVLQSFTLPVDDIRLLRSGGKGLGRHLEILHSSDLVPEKIHFVPKRPAKWYEHCESLGIATEDTVELRESGQLFHRVGDWLDNAEGLFWMGLILLIIATPVIAAIVHFLFR